MGGEKDPEVQGALVPLGVVARPHGVRGELRVHPFNPDSTLLYELDEVVLRGGEGRARTATVEHVRAGSKGAVLLTLTEVADREGADGLRGTEICIPRTRLPELEAGQWYHVDLVGLTVVGALGGEALGEVTEVLRYPTVDSLVVKSPDGVREVPLVDDYVGEIGVEDGVVVIPALLDVPLEKPKKRPKKKRGS